MSRSNGFKIRGLNVASNRVSIQSNVQTTWMLSRKKWKFWDFKPLEFEVGMDRDELIVIKCQDAAESAAIEITPLGDKVGTLIAQSSRRATKTLRVGSTYRWELEPGEALVMRASTIIYPTHEGAGLAV